MNGPCTYWHAKVEKTISYLLTLPQIFRHAFVSLEILLDLIKIFGPVIHSTLSASSTVGVDIQAEQRYGD
jgi:hypothetical protein